MSRTAFDPNGFNSPMWAKIRKVTISSNWQQTITNYYSDGVSTGITTGSFSGEATNRSDSQGTYVDGLGNFGTGETLPLDGPMMGLPSRFSGSCKGSGTQTSTTTYPDGSEDNFPPITWEFGAFDFSRESLYNTSNVREAVPWRIGGFVGTSPLDATAVWLTIPWGDFDQGGTWSNSWEETESNDTGSSTIVTSGTWTITLSL